MALAGGEGIEITEKCAQRVFCNKSLVSRGKTLAGSHSVGSLEPQCMYPPTPAARVVQV